MEPEDYLYVLKEVSKGLKESGQDSKIIGPATSTPEAAEDYIKLISLFFCPFTENYIESFCCVTNLFRFFKLHDLNLK